MLRRLITAAVLMTALVPVHAAHANESFASAWDCPDDMPLPASVWLDRLSTGWRPLRTREPGQHGWINERENAKVIFYAFREAGYPAAIAMAAIVNAWDESALDNGARMDRPFQYNGRDYPDGTGAIGLFQLLPSRSGAGGPSGPEQGYPHVFQDGRWAGTPWQAENHHDEPDAWGRRYYDATDPVLNTQRIILEVERDGDALMAAYERGASIAELAWIFGRDIERPSISTWYRRQSAVEMLGRELALSEFPERLFGPDPLDTVVPDDFQVECDDYHPFDKEPVVAAFVPPIVAGTGNSGLFALLGALLVGVARRR